MTEQERLELINSMFPISQKSNKIQDEDEKRKNAPVLSRQQYDKINEGLIKRNPALGMLDERIVYDRNFLLEVQHAGYNPLDKEDVKNFIEKKPPKDIDRNIKMCGADKYRELGQSEYSEESMLEFRAKTNKNPVAIKQKSPNDVYLSDIKNDKTKEYLIEKGTSDLENTLNRELTEKEKMGIKVINENTNDDILRRNLAKALGSDDIKPIERPQSNITEIVKHNPQAEKMLELIKELKTLGFSADEIKKEIQRFHS